MDYPYPKGLSIPKKAIHTQKAIYSPLFWRAVGGEAVIFIMTTFSIRSYTKKELSLMYFPDSIPNTAVKHLMGWIKRCTPLMGELQAMGYHTSNKTFTPRQVKAIVEQLGEP